VPGEPIPPAISPSEIQPIPDPLQEMRPEALRRLQPTGVGRIFPANNLQTELFNNIITAAREEIDRVASRAIENDQGIFYPSEPLGWGDAGRYVTVPRRTDTGELEPITLWQLDPFAFADVGIDTATSRPRMTEEQARRNLFSLSITEQELIKSKLVKVGLLKENQTGPAGMRFLDDTIMGAWTKVVGLSQLNLTDPISFLTDSVNEGRRFSLEGAPSAPTIPVPSSADVRQAANALAQREIGRRLTDEELDLVVQPYQRKYAQQQRRSLGGGVVETPPSVEAFTEGVISEEAEEEQALYSLGNTLDSFMGMLGGGR
jgi:hypothetical protein